ncbi:hypothetical protein C5167_036308 [Papaver somniferum]|uniref:Uncharacterized protein n=1 Tax=Papaver somniferum TaxID=3469 RepID=A0A4Y7I3B3_PAPSO|nr:hypothetical protein C5167_036308 [Papaver somniferum]
MNCIKSWVYGFEVDFESSVAVLGVHSCLNRLASVPVLVVFVVMQYLRGLLPKLQCYLSLSDALYGDCIVDSNGMDTKGLLGYVVHGSDSDIDALCIGPYFASMDKFQLVLRCLKLSARKRGVYCSSYLFFVTETKQVFHLETHLEHSCLFQAHQKGINRPALMERIPSKWPLHNGMLHGGIIEIWKAKATLTGHIEQVRGLAVSSHHRHLIGEVRTMEITTLNKDVGEVLAAIEAQL